jgi:uncharacterized protein
MMNHTKAILIFLLLMPFILQSQDSQAALDSIAKFQEQLNKEYKDPAKSPLTPRDLRRFKHHDFFPVDLKYRVQATVDRNVDDKPFKMNTSSGRVASYKKYGTAVFMIDGKEYKLALYQSLDLMKRDGYKDYLFLPFTDLTNGDYTYSGGRYIDLRISEGTELIIDFNKAYNPYCAYTSGKYSCPIVPSENDLAIKIEAGVKSKGHQSAKHQ